MADTKKAPECRNRIMAYVMNKRINYRVLETLLDNLEAAIIADNKTEKTPIQPEGPSEG
nr:MAG TPA: hypothetical protein [Caudoviricetes sp.]